MTLRVGEVVKLKCGGPRMSVTTLGQARESADTVGVAWFDSKTCQYRYARFAVDALERDTDGQA
jgi:uncharacterized protein YodC (DUF2158 family)